MTSLCHDYPTRTVDGAHLDATMTLIGDSGGLSTVYETTGSNLLMGCVVVTTEHGPLYLDPDEDYNILNYETADPDSQFTAPITNPRNVEQDAPAADAPAADDQPKIMARYHPQAWVNDCAIDVDGAYDFDVTAQIIAMGRQAALAIKDYDEDSDFLWLSAIISGQVRDQFGPFNVTVADAIRDYYGPGTDENDDNG